MTTATIPSTNETRGEITPSGLPAPTPANLETVEELDRSLDKKGTALELGRTVIGESDGVVVIDSSEGLYPRDGVVPVAHIEGQVSRVTIRGRTKNVIWASGMSAVRETVNFAAIHMAEQGTRRGGDPILAHGQELYSQSLAYFAKEKLKGVAVTQFDSGDEEGVIDTIEQGADVIFAETIANSPSMPVFNIHRVLRHIRRLDNPPLIVLDNTLPLRTGFPFAGLIRPDDPVIIVESGTKNLMNNSDLLGISYSANLDLIAQLRKHKAHSGAVNSLAALGNISATLRATIPGFHARNRAVFDSTAQIAAALAEAKAILGPDADFSTIFPTLPGHPNYDYAVSIKPDDVDGISPVVLMTADDWSEAGAPALIRRIAEHPAMREQIAEGQIHLGQSFGTPAARLLYDRNAPNVRFAGGFDLADADALAKAVKEAVADK